MSLEVEEEQDVKIRESGGHRSYENGKPAFAERDGVVKIHLTPGDSLDVGELILELR